MAIEKYPYNHQMIPIAKKPVRGSDGKYVQGNPGNRFGGRKLLPAEFKEFCRTTSVEKVKNFVARWDDLEDGMRLKVVEILLDRGWGKPAQHIDGDLTIRRVLLGDIPDAVDY